MNKSESKYYNTAILMDEALIRLLDKKDFEYITIKEICDKAGVNRSTFYLHYETMNDLLEETMEYVNRGFIEYMKANNIDVIKNITEQPKENLYFITPTYLLPYLDYIKENRRTYATVVKNGGLFRLDKTYEKMFELFFIPILDKFGIPEKQMLFTLAFYINGLMAIISEWLKQDCSVPTEEIAEIMQNCIKTIDGK